MKQDDVMKKRGLKKRRPLATNLRIDLWHQLNELTKETKINKSILIDEAIELLLHKYKKKIYREEDYNE